jgi:glycosyltransferase involved in cell wall biosynthesis
MVKVSRLAYVVKVFPKISETFIAGELVELRRRGVEVRMLSLQRPTETLQHHFIRQAGLDAVVCYEPGEFRAMLRQFCPQLLHAHFATEATAEARSLAGELGVPFTFTAHGYDIRRKPPPDFAERAAAAGKVVTVSEANAHHLRQSFGVPASQVRVIPCGVDTGRFRPAQRRERGVGGVPLMVCVARHSPVKNLALLLETCAELRSRAVAFRCVQIGDGRCRAELLALRAQLGLESLVEMPGACDHDSVLAWWQRADVAVLTSENEGMPVCLMEAAACGVPAAATAVGGVPELIRDGVTGFLTPSGDHNALADAVQALFADPVLASQLGQAARRRAEEAFSIRQQVDRLLELWTEVLA